jgi:hypothetical protein
LSHQLLQLGLTGREDRAGKGGAGQHLFSEMLEVFKKTNNNNNIDIFQYIVTPIRTKRQLLVSALTSRHGLAEIPKRHPSLVIGF